MLRNQGRSYNNVLSPKHTIKHTRASPTLKAQLLHNPNRKVVTKITERHSLSFRITGLQHTLPYIPNVDQDRSEEIIPNIFLFGQIGIVGSLIRESLSIELLIGLVTAGKQTFALVINGHVIRGFFCGTRVKQFVRTNFFPMLVSRDQCMTAASFLSPMNAYCISAFSSVLNRWSEQSGNSFEAIWFDSSNEAYVLLP